MRLSNRYILCIAFSAIICFPTFAQDASLNLFTINSSSNFDHRGTVTGSVQITGSFNLPRSWARVKIYLSTDAFLSSSDIEIEGAEFVVSNIRGATVDQGFSFQMPGYPDYICDEDGLFFVADVDAMGDSDGDNDSKESFFQSATVDVRLKNTWVQNGGIESGNEVVVGGRISNSYGCTDTDALMVYFLRRRSNSNFVTWLARRADGAGASYYVNNITPSQSHYFQFDLWVPSWVSSSTDYEICWVANPSQFIVKELDIDNNLACKPFCFQCPNGLASDPLSVKTNTIPNVTVGPNPTNGQLNVNYNIASTPMQIQLVDLKGSIILNRSLSVNDQTGKLTLNIGDQLSGVYFVRFLTKGKDPVAIKIVKL